MNQEKGKFSPLLAENIVIDLKKELKARNRVNEVDYWMNYVRIVQKDNVELIFKLVPCPPRGKICDFYFEHPTHGEHWHYEIFSKTLEDVGHPVMTQGGDCAVWQFFFNLEDGARLFFIKYGEMKTVTD